MQGSFTLQIILSQRLKGEKDTILFMNPGFPAHMTQAKVLGIKSESFDIYEYRGKKLEEKLESYLKKGNITALLYNNPNNPAWTNLTEEELEIIGRLATKYDCIVIEDLAYFGMDFRHDISVPGEPPFGATVARYTDNYILMLSKTEDLQLRPVSASRLSALAERSTSASMSTSRSSTRCPLLATPTFSACSIAPLQERHILRSTVWRPCSMPQPEANSSSLSTVRNMDAGPR